MNKDQLSGKMDQVKGRIKEETGEALGNQHLANQGVADQVKGAAKETWGNAKDAVHEEADLNRRQAEADANRTREGITNTVANIRDRLNENIDEHKEKVRRDKRSA